MKSKHNHINIQYNQANSYNTYFLLGCLPNTTLSMFNAVFLSGQEHQLLENLLFDRMENLCFWAYFPYGNINFMLT